MIIGTLSIYLTLGIFSLLFIIFRYNKKSNTVFVTQSIFDIILNAISGILFLSIWPVFIVLYLMFDEKK